MSFGCNHDISIREHSPRIRIIGISMSKLLWNCWGWAFYTIVWNDMERDVIYTSEKFKANLQFPSSVLMIISKSEYVLTDVTCIRLIFIVTTHFSKLSTIVTLPQELFIYDVECRGCLYYTFRYLLEVFPKNSWMLLPFFFTTFF